MKFDFVIGTPPYEDNNTKSNNSYASPVYHLFMDAAFNIASKVLLITPARFLFNEGATPKEWNEKILNDTHFKVVRYVHNSVLVFPETGIVGGVAISYRDTEKTYEPIKIFVKHIQLLSIVEKVVKTDFSPLSELIYSPESFRFTVKMYLDHPEIELQHLMSKGHRSTLESNIFNKLQNVVFFEEKPVDHEDYVQIYGRMDNERKYMWIKSKYIQGSENFNKYKIILARNGTGAIGEVLSTPLICKPRIGHTRTFLTIGCFETEDEANNCLKYIKTKFARAMHGVRKITLSNKKPTWAFVPQQNFTFNSDIDWTKAINEIDLQLYRKYNLTEAEIEFIESNVRPMND